MRSVCASLTSYTDYYVIIYCHVRVYYNISMCVYSSMYCSVVALRSSMHKVHSTLLHTVVLRYALRFCDRLLVLQSSPH
jgi:hypothetical protein